jgi:BirA family biotin operon repressor/biotin-[acetyl-CoA-carboxylase] ligase
MWNILEFDEVVSTSSLAKELWLAGEARHGDVFHAQHQTGGRGRIAGREWVDTPGESLLMTVLLERIPPEVLRTATCDSSHSFQMLAARAVVAALREVATGTLGPERMTIKAPNDILLDGRKLCGILTEAIWQGSELRALIIGIGVNVHQRSFEEPLADVASSLAQTSVETSVNRVRDAILLSMERTLLSPFSVT